MMFYYCRYGRWAPNEPQEDPALKSKCVYMNHTTGLWVSTLDCGFHGVHHSHSAKFPFLCNKPTRRSNFIAT